MSQCMDGVFFFFYLKDYICQDRLWYSVLIKYQQISRKKKSQQIKTVNFSSHKTFFFLPMEKEEVGKITCEKEKNIKKKKEHVFHV